MSVDLIIVKCAACKELFGIDPDKQTGKHTHVSCPYCGAGLLYDSEANNEKRK